MNRKTRRLNDKLNKKIGLYNRTKKDKFKTIAIGRLAKDFVYASFDQCFAQLCAVSSEKFNLAALKQDSPLPHFGRDIMVEKAREIGADYLFFIDSDEEFSPDTLIRLYRHKKDIIVANYPKRIKPYQNVNPDPIPETTEGDLCKLYWAATGCMLIDMKVFDKMHWPYFDTVQKLGENNEKIRIGEDQYFCIKARAAGFDVWCDTSIRIGHTGIETHYL